jgi:hypothetical protein
MKAGRSKGELPFFSPRAKTALSSLGHGVFDGVLTGAKPDEVH